MVFPEGERGAHDFANRSREPVRVAIFSTRRPGTAFYPESDKVGAGPPDDRRYHRRSAAVGFWNGESGDASV